MQSLILNASPNIKAQHLEILECRSNQRRRCLKISLHKSSLQSIVNSRMVMETFRLQTINLLHSPIWLEDESQRIGFVNIPNDLWKNMRRSPLYFLDIPFEKRLQHIVGEYGDLDKQKMIDAIGRIRERLGGLNAKTAIQLLEEGNIIESFRILLKYYDKYYLKGLHNRENLNSLLYTIECDSVTPENANKLVTQLQYQIEAS